MDRSELMRAGLCARSVASRRATEVRVFCAGGAATAAAVPALALPLLTPPAAPVSAASVLSAACSALRAGGLEEAEASLRL